MEMPENNQPIELEQLYRLYHEEMCQLADSILHDAEEARDVVGEVFTRIAEQLPKVDAEKWQSYLLTAVRNRCRDIMAHRRVEQKAMETFSYDAEYEDDARPVQTHEAVDMFQYVERELSPRTHQIFVMRFEENKSYREISQKLGISIPAVYKHVLLARRKITARFVGIFVLLLAVVVVVAIGVRRLTRWQPSAEPDVESSVQVNPEVDNDGIKPVIITFENATLSEIVNQIAVYYHVKADFRKAEVSRLRLYFQWNQHESLSETLDALNSFERFSIKQADDGTLIVE